ncbi:alpha/beta hydrolase [Pseudonocardia spinosispora]|uniref:alpha/beta hydrolase n=1 Tax=Pseudonocardia spinosispora TaxID=103441 RepID=UPI00040E152C|nr:alpha/beta hydrolase [Pseudonocardia spinosispora]
MTRPVQLRTSDGYELHGVSLPGPGDGAPTALLLHSANQTHRAMLPLAESLRDVAEVIVPDLRGFGASRCPDPASHSWERLALDTLDWTRTRPGPVVLVGFALGAAVAVRAAELSDSSLSGLAVLAPHHQPGEPVPDRAVEANRALADRIESSGVSTVLDPWLSSLPAELASSLRRDIGLTDPASLVASFRGLNSVNPVEDADLVVRAGRRVPRVLVVPGDDSSHPASVGARYVELLAGSADLRVSSALAGSAQPSAQLWASLVAESVRRLFR